MDLKFSILWKVKVSNVNKNQFVRLELINLPSGSGSRFWSWSRPGWTFTSFSRPSISWRTSRAVWIFTFLPSGFGFRGYTVNWTFNFLIFIFWGTTRIRTRWGIFFWITHISANLLKSQNSQFFLSFYKKRLFVICVQMNWASMVFNSFWSKS